MACTRKLCRIRALPGESAPLLVGRDGGAVVESGRSITHEVMNRTMPIYEYRCGDCGRRVSLFYQSVSLAEAGQAAARCPRCGGVQLTRLVSRFNVGRPGPKTA